MNQAKVFELTPADKKAIARAFQRFNESTISAREALSSFVKVSEMLRSGLPSVKDADKNLRAKKLIVKQPPRERISLKKKLHK